MNWLHKERREMKKLLLLISVLLAGCNTPANVYRDLPEFNWMPDPLTWDRNIRDCRTAEYCNAANLFNRY